MWREGAGGRPPGRPVLTSTGYARLALAYLGFVVYGSLVPFHFRPLSPGDAVEQFRAVCQAPVTVDSKSDWVTNVLLGVPLSFSLMGALGVDRFLVGRGGPRDAARHPPRPGAGSLGDAVLVLPACAAAAFAVEFAQLFFPPRVSSLNDVVAQTAGAGAGVALWLACGQRCTEAARRFWSPPGGEGPSWAARLFPAYLAVLVLVHVAPLDLTIHPVELYHKYQAGHVRLVPFAGALTGDDFGVGPFDAVRKHVLNVAFFLPAGLLLGALPGGKWRGRPGAARVAGVGLALAGGVEFLQLFVQSRRADASDIVTGALAVWLGWGFARALGWADAPRISRPGGRGHPALRGLALVCWLAVLTFVAWEPFDFSADPWARWAGLSWLPFADTHLGDPLNALAQVLQKVVLFLPLGALLTPRPRPGGVLAPALLPAVAFALVVAAVLEAGQLFLPTRYPSPTDVVVQTAGAFLGAVVARRVQETTRPPDPGPPRRRSLAGLEETLSALRRRTARA